MVRLDEIVPWAENPRINDVAAIKTSITRFGLVDPLIVNVSGGAQELVAGHGRRLALLELKGEGKPAPRGVTVGKGGEWSVLVIDIALNPVEARAYALADNRTQELGGWDDEKLVEVLAALKQSGDGNLLAATGYDSDDLDALIGVLAQSVAKLGAGEDSDDDGLPDTLPKTEISGVTIEALRLIVTFESEAELGDFMGIFGVPAIPGRVHYPWRMLKGAINGC